MKELIKVISIVALALVYCLEIGSAYNHSSQNPTLSQDNSSYVTSASLNMIGSASSTEDLIISINNTLSIPNKVFFQSYIATVKTTQQIFAKEFTQYTFFSKNFLVLFQKTDIIYPFNYFW